jgi:hypothetical protein
MSIQDNASTAGTSSQGSDLAPLAMIVIGPPRSCRRAPAYDYPSRWMPGAAGTAAQLNGGNYSEWPPASRPLGYTFGGGVGVAAARRPPVQHPGGAAPARHAAGEAAAEVQRRMAAPRGPEALAAQGSFAFFVF